MKLTFLGTRGNIKAATPRHRRHSALLVSYRRSQVMVDCGEDWQGEVFRLRPQAIVLTHAHEDHAHGLKDGAPCPVYASAETWEHIDRFPIAQRHLLLPRQPVRIGNILVEPFPVQHSLRAPAVGLRISAGDVSIFYAPDLVFIRERPAALSGCRLYIGDGATLKRPLIRLLDGQPCGHTPIRTQLSWCAKEGVPEMIVTHCGSQIVTGEGEDIAAQLLALALEKGVRATIAWDGMERVLR